MKYAMFMGPQACNVHQSSINGAQYECMQKAYPVYSDTYGPFACPFDCMIRNKETKIMNPMYNWMLPMMKGILLLSYIAYHTRTHTYHTRTHI
jgi:hypothetical protein